MSEHTSYVDREPDSENPLLMVLRSFAPTVLRYKWLFLAMSLFMVLTVVTKAVYPPLLRDLLDGLQAESPSVETTIMLIVITFVLHNAFWTAFDPLIALFQTKVMRDLDQQSLESVQRQSMQFFHNKSAGSLVTATRRFSRAFEVICDSYVFSLGRSATMALFTLLFFALEEPMLAGAFIIWAMAYCYLSYRFAKLRMKRDTEAADADSAVGSAFADTFMNHTAVKTYAEEKSEQSRFNDITEDCHRKRKRSWIFGGVLMRIQGLVIMVFELIVIWWLVTGWRAGTVDAGDFVFFQTYILVLMHQVWDVGNVLHRVFQNVAEAREVARIYKLEPTVQDVPGATELSVNPHNATIAFDHVGFHYPGNGGKDHPDLHDVSFSVPAGKTLAIVGHTGAGKSTITSLLMRLYDIQSGSITIAGQNIEHVTQHSLRKSIAFVSQQPFLLNRTVRENIAMANPEATEKELIAAAQQAHAWEFIQELPNGIDTVVGERGLKLSGGQAQRLMLARAFLAVASGRSILIIDEGTSALDSKTEKDVQESLSDLLNGRTSIVIAHRLSTVKRADAIMVLEKGQVVEYDTHAELLEKGGIYADLWEHQSGGMLGE